jgi:hypothetical protein
MSVMNVAQDSTETNVDHSEYNSNSTFEVGLKEHYSNIHDAYVSCRITVLFGDMHVRIHDMHQAWVKKRISLYPSQLNDIHVRIHC